MSWRSGKTREYTLISLCWVMVRPVSSLTSLINACWRVSPFSSSAAWKPPLSLGWLIISLQKKQRTIDLYYCFNRDNGHQLYYLVVLFCGYVVCFLFGGHGLLTLMLVLAVFGFKNFSTQTKKWW